MTRFGPAARPLRGTLRPPPDKSISHRAALIAAMGDGESRIDGYLDAADTRATIDAIRVLGADVETLGPSSATGGVDLRVGGIGLRGPGMRADRDAEPVALDVKNAGTLLRVLPGWLAGQGAGSWVIDGDASIRGRPVDRVIEPLRMMGGRIEGREDRFAALHVEGATLHGISYQLPMASAQVKSCVLIAGLLAEGETTIVEPAPTRDHTERMLAARGVDTESVSLRTVPGVGGKPELRITVSAIERLEPMPIAVPGDFSSSAFFVVAATIIPGSDVRVEGVGLNPTRIGLLGILNRMGAPLEVEEEAAGGIEPRGTIRARHGPLAAARVRAEEVPLAIDELPLVALLGCFAEGTTVVSGAEELRVKESDRIATVVEGLRRAGAEIEAREDGFAVRGTGELRGGAVDPRHDHRLAMLGAIAGLASREGVEVFGMEASGVSYPRFETDLRALLAGLDD
jgi:3-phosphoshikimate 1-carboxyvinyltransferase